MKKVRFESPVKRFSFRRMTDTECHSPRPFIERQIPAVAPEHFNYPRILPYTNDPEQKFECSNSSPYPIVNKTQLSSEAKPKWSPSNELDLSMLDVSFHEPRKPAFCKSILKTAENNGIDMNRKENLHILTPVESNNVNPPNVLSKDDDFFIKRGNISKFQLDINPVQNHLNRLSLDKENDPFAKKAELVKKSVLIATENKPILPQPTINNINDCRCHHCVKSINTPQTLHVEKVRMMPYNHTAMHNTDYINQNITRHNHCHCILPPQPMSACCQKTLGPGQISANTCNFTEHISSPKTNAVDKKSWAIEKYEQSNKLDCREVEKQMNVVKEKREPTVADLFKIIKLQNEQLQLLQEKVDKFISTQNQKSAPTENRVPVLQSTQHVAIETVDSEEHKISIGVMTSFELVRTSTIINKEVVKSNENAQIQCNRSHISIKEVVSKAPNLNFLDGIPPVDKTVPDLPKNGMNLRPLCDGNEEKTINELSLYNVQVDNATTPLMSPDQSLYLDIRDYSESEGSDDQSNVGWTYYNKVMTQVNGMLQDSDMPSSASALYRNTRQQMQTVQMQIDKTNVSVTKRVKFGDDPLGIHQPHIYGASTDTSLKMNQLAAKYLKNGSPIAALPKPTPKVFAAPLDMSFATRNYMERHKLLQGIPSSPCEMPRFLDITALKRQSKLL